MSSIDLNSSINILVTGVNGFVASHVLTQLLELGYNVKGTIRPLKDSSKLTYLNTLKEKYSTFTLVEGDLLDSINVWEKLINNCDYVIHIASPCIIDAPDFNFFEPAVNGTLNILKACKFNNVKRVVVTSSCITIEHGHSKKKLHFNELDRGDPDKFKDSYQHSKILAEIAAWKYAVDNNLDLVTIHPGWVLGPLYCKNEGASATAIADIMSRKYPLLPNVLFFDFNIYIVG